MLRIMKNGWSKTHRSPPRSAGVLRWNCWPSTYQVMTPGSQSTVKVWKASAYAPPPGSGRLAPMPSPPE
jgi:hypothetical protein